MRIVEAGHKADVTIRLIGGVAIGLHAQETIPASLARSYGDVDLVTGPKAAKQTIALMVDLEYESNERFNAVNGHERLVFYDLQHARQVDVFVGEFRMCHRLPIAERLHISSSTAPLAELLLTKLQIARVNQKDVKDIYTLLLEHEVGGGDDEVINAEYIAKLLSADWGLWRTSTGTLAQASAQLDAIGLQPEHRTIIETRIEQLRSVIDASPKSLKWRSRARVGERVRWYDEPEEVGHRIAGET